MHVFRLSSFESDACGSEPAALSRQNLKDQRLERTKGTHLYAVSRLGGSHLRVAVAVGKKLLLLQWRHSAAWTAWCPTSDTDTVEGFQYLRVSCDFLLSFRLNSVGYQLTSRGECGGINQSIGFFNFVFSFPFSALGGNFLHQRSFNWARRLRWWRSSIQAPVSLPVAKATTKSVSDTATSSTWLTSERATRDVFITSRESGPISCRPSTSTRTKNPNSSSVSTVKIVNLTILFNFLLNLIEWLKFLIRYVPLSKVERN